MLDADLVLLARQRREAGGLFRERLEIGDQVLAVLLVSDTGEGHLVTGHGRARIEKIFHQLLFGPHPTLRTGLLVRGRVIEALDGARVAPDDAVEDRADLVLRFLTYIMAGAAALEDFRTILDILCGDHVRIE